MGVSLAIGPALVTDLVPQEILGKALALYGFAPPAGGILGFSLTGYAIQSFGMTNSSIGAAMLTLIAVLILLQVRHIRPQVAASSVERTMQTRAPLGSSSVGSETWP